MGNSMNTQGLFTPRSVLRFCHNLSFWYIRLITIKRRIFTVFHLYPIWLLFVNRSASYKIPFSFGICSILFDVPFWSLGYRTTIHDTLDVPFVIRGLIAPHRVEYDRTWYFVWKHSFQNLFTSHLCRIKDKDNMDLNRKPPLSITPSLSDLNTLFSSLGNHRSTNIYCKEIISIDVNPSTSLPSQSVWQTHSCEVCEPREGTWLLRGSWSGSYSWRRTCSFSSTLCLFLESPLNVYQVFPPFDLIQECDILVSFLMCCNNIGLGGLFGKGDFMRPSVTSREWSVDTYPQDE